MTAIEVMNDFEAAKANFSEVSSLINERITNAQRTVAAQHALYVAEKIVPRLDKLCQAGREFLDVPVCLLTLLTENHQFFPGASGIDSHQQEEGTTTHKSLCQFVVTANTTLSLPDMNVYPKIADLTDCLNSNVHSYLGAPWYFNSQTVGSYCALDDKKREWTEEEKETIEELAEYASALINHHKRKLHHY